jgi:hypothetical protein
MAWSPSKLNYSFVSDQIIKIYIRRHIKQLLENQVTRKLKNNLLISVVACKQDGWVKYI